MSVIRIDFKSRNPIYEQIMLSVKDSVVRGLLMPGEALPSVRALATELAINPNTIQKAYSELEHQGIVYTVPGKGCFVNTDTREMEAGYRHEVMDELKSALMKAGKAGITVEEITRMAEETRRENG